ncbi:hypothetical protein QBC37DRAFT_374448 [Rhypophila decipiens]|uniref:Uncharacterized protein n=1 Tax=Rhypophila decipiens TaxID=261697 RepID=A0AAN6Y6A6_9PEZI|nr:hypothetical protein QBC37DRAFT_374448 [Rhypophila decipiens]
MPYDEITRDGFKSSFNRFYADPGHIELVSSDGLKDMFLPRMTATAKEVLVEYGEDFVIAQLKFYGVEYDYEKDFYGNGARLLQKKLKEGKLDKLPDHVARLKEDMYSEWLKGLTNEELARHPEHAIRKYFVDSEGKPLPPQSQMSNAQTGTVVGFPADSGSSQSDSEEGSAGYPVDTGSLQSEEVSGLRKAAEAVGLHHATGPGCGGKQVVVYIGWSKSAVDQAVESAKKMS